MLRISLIIWFQLANVRELTISSPLALAEGLYYFYELFYRKRRIIQSFVE